MKPAVDSGEYWDEYAAPYLRRDDEWLAVCTRESVPVARATYELERRGVHLIDGHLPRGGAVLEVGCGYGRWFRVLGRGRTLLGADFSEVMARRAAELHPDALVMIADARRLPIEPASLAGCYSVKALQYVPREARPALLRGIFDAVAPGGVVALFETTRGPLGSPPAAWIEWATTAGGRLVTWVGNQYLPLDRLLSLPARSLASGTDEPTEGSMAPGRSGATGARRRRDRFPWLFRTYTAARAVVLRLSLPLEPILERFAPRAWSTHGIFVFTKT